MITPFSTKAALNLKKARGLLDALFRMAEEGKYCMDLIQQCNAVIGILQQTNNTILESHLHTCGAKLNSLKEEEKEAFIREILRACTVSQRK